MNKRNLYQAGSAVHIRLPPAVIWKAVILGVISAVGISFLFYRSVWALLPGMILIPVFLQKESKIWHRLRKERIQKQFISCMQLISGSLLAGYSMENAWKQVLPELSTLYGAQSEICVELKKMNQRLDMNEPLEQILFDFAETTQVEDILNFTEIFRYAKRSGGNINEIIRRTVERMQEKAELLGKIETAVAAKKMEQRIMVILLPGVLLFVTLSSPVYASSLYHNPAGIIVMSICLAGYIGCCIWSDMLTNIAV